jgi:hypothetical protein
MPATYQARGKLPQATTTVIPAPYQVRDKLRLGSMDSSRQGGTGMTSCIFMKSNLIKITSSATVPKGEDWDIYLIFLLRSVREVF